MHPEAQVRQRNLADITGLNEGHVSRVVGKLVDTGLVERVNEGIRVVDADLLLDAWREEYRFNRHTVISGHVAARSGVELVRLLAGKLSELEVPYARDWSVSRMVMDTARWIPPFHHVPCRYSFGRVDVGIWGSERLPGEPTPGWWFPTTGACFTAPAKWKTFAASIRYRSTSILQGHPERAEEAADELRSRLLMGGADER